MAPNKFVIAKRSATSNRESPAAVGVGEVGCPVEGSDQAEELAKKDNKPMATGSRERFMGWIAGKKYNSGDFKGAEIFSRFFGPDSV